MKSLLADMPVQGEAQVVPITWWLVCTWLECLNCQKVTEKKQDVTILMSPTMSNPLVYGVH